MTQIPPNNIFLSDEILQKSVSKVGSEFVHPTEESLEKRTEKLDPEIVESTVVVPEYEPTTDPR